MDIISNNKQLSLDENECIKPCGHRWIIKNKKYICEYCKKESDAFKELKDFESTLPQNSISS